MAKVKQGSGGWAWGVRRARRSVRGLRRPTSTRLGFRRGTIGNDLLARLAQDSEWGGNNFERAADGAAHRKNHRFSNAQVIYQTPMTSGGYTVVDRIAPNNQLVYLDGIWHRLRPEAAAKDFLQDMDLRYRYNATVIRITDTEFNRDPINTIHTRIDWTGGTPYFIPETETIRWERRLRAPPEIVEFDDSRLERWFEKPRDEQPEPEDQVQDDWGGGGGDLWVVPQSRHEME